MRPQHRSSHSHSVCSPYDSTSSQHRTAGRTIRPRSVLLTFHSSCHVDVHTNCHMIHTNHIQQDCTMRTSEQKQNKGLDTESGVQQVHAKPHTLSLSLSYSLSYSLSLSLTLSYSLLLSPTLSISYPLIYSLLLSLSLFFSLSLSLSLSLIYSLSLSCSLSLSYSPRLL